MSGKTMVGCRILTRNFEKLTALAKKAKVSHTNMGVMILDEMIPKVSVIRLNRSLNNYDIAGLKEHGVKIIHTLDAGAVFAVCFGDEQAAVVKSINRASKNG